MNFFLNIITNHFIKNTLLTTNYSHIPWDIDNIARLRQRIFIVYFYLKPLYRYMILTNCVIFFKISTKSHDATIVNGYFNKLSYQVN